MLHEHRCLISAALSAGLGTTGLSISPFRADNAVLRLLHVAHSTLWTAMAYADANLWFTTVWLACNVVTSLRYIFLGRIGRQTVNRRFPPHPPPGPLGDLFVVLGEQHHANGPMRSTAPQWLTVPARVGIPAWPSSGRSAPARPRLHLSVCRPAPGLAAGDEARKLSALILEVRRTSADTFRTSCCVTGVPPTMSSQPHVPCRYNPLHNDLDAYALAYGIATLMTILFVRR